MPDTTIPFAFDDALVRVIMRDGEPWFVLVDVARVLGLSNYRNAFARLDDDEKGVHTLDTPGGPQTVTILSESGLYALIMTSRKPEAKRFRKWVTGEVLPSIRRTGRYDAGATPAIEEPAIPPMLSPWEAFRAGDPVGVTWFNAVVAGAAVIQRTSGRAGLVSYMRDMGVPLHGQPASLAVDLSGAEACLAHLFACPVAGGDTVAEALAAARRGDAGAVRHLLAHGLAVTADFGGGVWVANIHPFLTDAFAGTVWSAGGWRLVLKRLPGTMSPSAHNRHRFGTTQSRATFVPWGVCPF